VAIKSSTHIYMHSSQVQNETCLFLLHNYENWSKIFPKIKEHLKILGGRVSSNHLMYFKLQKRV